MKEIMLEATIDNIIKATEFVDKELEKANCPMDLITQFDIAIDEIFSNIANYAYNPKIGHATVKVEITDDPQSVILTFLDNGVPYDPLKKEDPDVAISVKERQIGGLGIFMVKQMMDDIDYEYKNDQNILTIKKHF